MNADNIIIFTFSGKGPSQTNGAAALRSNNLVGLILYESFVIGPMLMIGPAVTISATDMVLQTRAD